MQKRDENFGNLPEGVKPAKVCEDVGFTTTVIAAQFFMTRSAVELRGSDVSSSCREYTPILVTMLEATEIERLEPTPKLVFLWMLLSRSSTNDTQ